MKLQQIINESIQGYHIPKKDCGCGCNTCHLTELKNPVKEKIKEQVRKVLEVNDDLESKYDRVIEKNLEDYKMFKGTGKEQKYAERLFDLFDFYLKNFGKKHRLDPERNINKLGLKLDKVQMNEDKTSTIIKLEGILVTNTKERNQKDILSDIRSISGITIVSSRDIEGGDNFDGTSRTSLSVKIDPHPFIGKGGFGKEQLQNIYNEIKRVVGVKTFKLTAKPKRI